jgi:hypothetical protein
MRLQPSAFILKEAGLFDELSCIAMACYSKACVMIHPYERCLKASTIAG